jgi:hypothetical protein
MTEFWLLLLGMTMGGALSFEGAFLGNILLGTGKTVLDTIEAQKLLPPAEPEQKLRIAK